LRKLGVILIKWAKNHVKWLPKFLTLLHIFMWCHYNAMLIMGNLNLNNNPFRIHLFYKEK
jgi:hypothetical protein